MSTAPSRLTSEAGTLNAYRAASRTRWPAQVNPEKYFEHAEQTVPDDKPMEYVKVKVRVVLRAGRTRRSGATLTARGQPAAWRVAHDVHQTAEKMADVTEESKMAAHMLKNYAQEVTDKVVQTVRAPFNQHAHYLHNIDVGGI